VSAFGEIVEETGGGILYAPNNPKALAEALAALLGDPERALEYGRAGRQAVQRDFTIEKTARMTRAVYDEIVRTFHGPGAGGQA